MSEGLPRYPTVPGAILISPHHQHRLENLGRGVWGLGGRLKCRVPNIEPGKRRRGSLPSERVHRADRVEFLLTNLPGDRAMGLCFFRLWPSPILELVVG
jgi:hypothetical protein